MDPADSLQEKLDAKKIVIMDGGTGTEISRRGVTLQTGCSWSANANIAFPDLLRDIHRDYILAGAEIITTNTFSTSRDILKREGLSEQTDQINKQSVRLAMDARKHCAAEETITIAGSIGAANTGTPEIIHSKALKNYQEQVQILAEAGVELIILEMFTRTADLKAAVEATTETGLSIWVGLSCIDHDGQLQLGLRDNPKGESIADAVMVSSSPHVKAFCIMHSPPQVTAAALRELRNSTSLPIGAYAHGASTGSRVVGQPLDETDPQTYLEYAHEWIACGATIIGGCCGTTPEHIQVLTASDLRHANH
jgi:homocysteine S-methyltransferase